ncbi:hypothetical protein F5B22DRAFT_645701 [Xylaria bambusicola]|uniref:uncharacterized protein n=1 Tax=Xylaria bambusicola TaxID=326684 RepID=UPI0020075C17|nr:uncharacterized protein F5B22DRAFT_645701 [Xylaria bambusicola]KAI0517517.1 hypothetical protein F5B22DRAFT_645701 [Xylaria bambusicola]
MYPSTLISLFAATLASGMTLIPEVLGRAVPSTTPVIDTCWSTGENWGADSGLAKNYAAQACNNAFVGTSGSRTWQPGDEIQQCYNLDSTKKADFTIINENSAPATLTSGDCYTYLTKQISGCGQGGYQEHAGFEFKADPNSGQCATN